jgi:hypothetical protein
LPQNPHEALSKLLDLTAANFDCKFFNRGRTPAKLISCKIRSEVCTPESLPPHPSFGIDTINLNGIVVTPNDHERQEISIDEATLKQFGESKRDIFIYGVVDYLDAFKRKHYTRFRFRARFLEKIEPSDEIYLLKDGPASYHEAT